MENKGRSEQNLFGGYTHYDEKGKKTGTSYPGLFGGYTNYDSRGHKTGTSYPGFFGGYTHYDNNGHKTGYSNPSLFGGYTHYDNKGQKTGRSDPGLLGGYSNKGSVPNRAGNSSASGSSEGCYVATCVYGSYDAPQVWTLRRFRDQYLDDRFWGRAFIRMYYAVSPTLVHLFGETAWFRRFWRSRLDTLVGRLHQHGYSDTPYTDKARNRK